MEYSNIDAADLLFVGDATQAAAHRRDGHQIVKTDQYGHWFLKTSALEKACQKYHAQARSRQTQRGYQHEDSGESGAVTAGLIRIRSRRLIEELIAQGCRPVVRHKDGQATFEDTPTVRQVIRDYTARRDRAQAVQDYIVPRKREEVTDI
jgi:hypothetical protein